MTHTNAVSAIGKYQLQEFLGGGMSHVFRAYDTILGRTVAVKILTDGASADPDAKARFLAEARMASQLSHDNILGIYDFGLDEQHRPFMVMEFLEGRDLRQVIRENQAANIGDKLAIALQVARAIRYIHTRQVIHRDIKPENVFLTPTGVAKLMDFGIAKTAGVNLTRAGFVLGTPHYMAPEQVSGQPLTAQVDVYAFGVMLYELLTGVKPIAGKTLDRVFDAILNEPLDLSLLDTTDAPAAIRDLVVRCTAKDPAARPQGFDAICALLEAPAEPPPAAPSKRRSRTAMVCAAAALTLACGFAGLVWNGYRQMENPLTSAAIATGGVAQLTALRTFAERFDPKNATSLPLPYRLGALVWGDLRPAAQRLYAQRFHSALLDPVTNHVTNFLRTLPATPGPAYGQVYEALKLYEVTTLHPEKSDARFLAPALLRWWETGGNPTAEQVAAARLEFEAYGSQRHSASPADAALIDRARQYLNHFGDGDRIYAMLLDDAEKHAAALNFNRQFAGTEGSIRETYEVPGAYTKAGWDFMRDAVAHRERYFAGEPWVTGKDAQSAADAHLAENLMARYRSEYIAAWRQYLQNGSLEHFVSVSEAAQRLEQLDGDSSSITLWLAAASQNTAVVAPAFQTVDAAVSAGADYRATLAHLAAAIRKSSGQPALDAVAQALQAVKKVETAANLDATLAHVLEEPVMATRAVLRVGGPAEWNTLGEKLGARIKPLLAKYPFTRNVSEQATVAEIAAVFQPKDGALWKLYDGSLQKLIARQGAHFTARSSAGLTVNTAFLAFLDRAAAFGDSLFGQSDGQMRVRYTLRPVLPPDVDSVRISVDGQSAAFKGASPAKTLFWPGTGVAEMHVNVKFKNKTEFNWSKQGTPWALFQFLDTARRHQGPQVEIPLSGASTMWFEVIASPAVFDAGYFAGMNYVAEIVKP